MSYGEHFILKTTFRNTETEKGTGLKKARKEDKKSKAIRLAKVAMKNKKMNEKENVPKELTKNSAKYGKKRFKKERVGAKDYIESQNDKKKERIENGESVSNRTKKKKSGKNVDSN